MRQFMKKEQGNALILGALSFAVLTAFGVLTIDVGRLLVTKNQLQNAADAGALAGASLFCEQADPADADVQSQVRLVGGSHLTLAMDKPEKVDIPNAQIAITRLPEEGRNVVEVTTKSVTRQYFLNLLVAMNWGGPGGTSDEVTAVAAAACGATCGVTCVKPWSIPDRWDDNTPVNGYTGGTVNGKKAKNWRNNNHWDSEFDSAQDTNNNGLWDPGEGFTDDNGNGQYDQEAYNPLLTGYIPDPYPGNLLAPNGDLGLELTLKAGNPLQSPEPGQYFPVDLPPINRGTPITGGDQYRDNIAACNAAQVWPGDWLQMESGNMVGPTNQGMRDLIAQDPGAYWDDVTQSVQNSKFQISPRIVLVPIHDPRIPIKSGNSNVQVTKIVAFFMEQMEGSGDVRGRFLKVRNPGEPCVAGAGGAGGAVSFTYQLSLIK
jgi:hypothetical protein